MVDRRGREIWFLNLGPSTSLEVQILDDYPALRSIWWIYFLGDGAVPARAQHLLLMKQAALAPLALSPEASRTLSSRRRSP